MARSVLGYWTVTVVTILATFAGTFHDLRWVLSRGREFDHHLSPATGPLIRPKDLSGVSIISWCLATLTSAEWLVYGILIHQPPLAIPSLVMMPSALIIFIQASRHRIQNNSKTGLQAPLVE
jgi:hypothetical protein